MWRRRPRARAPKDREGEAGGEARDQGGLLDGVAGTAEGIRSSCHRGHPQEVGFILLLVKCCTLTQIEHNAGRANASSTIALTTVTRTSMASASIVTSMEPRK